MPASQACQLLCLSEILLVTPDQAPDLDYSRNNRQYGQAYLRRHTRAAGASAGKNVVLTDPVPTRSTFVA